MNSKRYYDGLEAIQKPNDVAPPNECPKCGNSDFDFVLDKYLYPVAYCSSCGYRYGRVRKNKNKNRRRKNGVYTNWLNNIREKFNHKCAFCGETKDLQVHHIIPVSVDIDLEVHPNNGILLCPKHHRKVHGETK